MKTRKPSDQQSVYPDQKVIAIHVDRNSAEVGGDVENSRLRCFSAEKVHLMILGK